VAIDAKNLSNFSPQIMMMNMMNENNNNRFGFINSNAVGNNNNNQAAAFGIGFNNNNIGSMPTNSNLNFSPLLIRHQSMKAESGLTCNLPPSRKRSRDSIEDYQILQKNIHIQNQNHMEFSSFLGEDFSVQIQQQQLEIDQIIAHHNKKVRMELEERQKQHARMLVSVIGEGVVKKLNEKDEQIQRIGKLNMALQEKVKSLCVENQLWRDLAQSNEAAAISLRSNLEQVLAHVSEDRGDPAAVAEDGESCCGSNDVVCGGEEEIGSAAGGDRRCRKCGEGEACVLLLPCRHLCVCTTCGSQLLQACPVCNSRMTATVHVNMS
jgi:E3 ubiquitin-protein ligase BOI-like protein